jgi:4a-hydroxytetrahydrobiopterin dehydratase
MKLERMRCLACEGKEPRLKSQQVRKLLPKIKPWRLEKGRLVRDYKFKDFVRAMRFVNAVARVAEKNFHHPNILVHSWNRVRLEYYTHWMNGLCMSDFVMAAKINRLKA